MRSPTIAAAALAALLAMAPGRAPAAEAKAPPPQADLGKKRQSAPDASLAGTLETRKAVRESGPRLEFEQFRFAVELQVSGKRREEMRDLGKLIRLGGNAQEMPGWLFRLAELHWEEAQYFFFEANRRDDQIAALGARPDPRVVEGLRAEKRDLEAQSQQQQDEAIGLYRDILKRWPGYPRLDEVVFFLGENLWKRQQREDALKAYKLLITRFEKSRYVPDAWMAFGEFYFDSAEKGARNENLKKALESYKRAAAHAESSIYGYALYKQGWVHYNLGEWTAALDLFRGVILFGELPTSTIAPEKKIALVREAKRDYVRTYSHVGAAEAAQEDFKRVGGDGWREMLRSLAGLYYEEGKDREAILVYHQLIQLDPVGAEAPLFQSRIVTSAGRMGRKDLAVQQAHRFVKMVREIEASGAARDEKGKKALADARADAENTLRTLAVSYHNEYRKTRDEPVARLAAEVYGAYLDVFPQTPQLYTMRFFHAELLFALERYQEAGDEYARVARMDAERMAQRPPQPGKYFAESLEGAVHSYDFVSRKSEGQARARSGDARQRQPIAKVRQQLLDACEAYLKWQPAGQKRVEIAYKAADVYYRHNHFPEAVRLFADIAQNHPRHEVAAYAANLVLDSHNLQGDWRGMSSWAQRFYREDELLRAHPALREDLARVIEQSGFKVVEELEREKRYGAAADAYLGFVREWPASKLAPTALFNASVDLSKAGQPERALEVRDRLMKAYPNDPLAAKVVFANAQDYEAAGDFEKAADASERYFAEWRRQQAPAAPPPRKGKAARAPPPRREAAGPYEEQKAQDALYNAGVFREGLSQYKKAEADRTLFVETWPRAPETPRVFLSVADLHAKSGNRTAEVKQLEEYQRRWAGTPEEWLGIQARIARAWEKAGNRDAARKARSQALAYYRQKGLTPGGAGDRGLTAVAEGMLIELEPAFASWDRITLDVKPKHLKAQLEVKGKKLLELERQYGAVVQLKQAEPAVCALTRIGTLYERMARTLVEAPVPKELRGQKEFVQEYKAQLAAFAEAPQQKAVEGMEIAVAKSRELGVRNECSREAEAALARAKPDKYGPVLEKVPEPAGPAPRERVLGYGLLGSLKSWDAARRPAEGTVPSRAAPAAARPDLPPVAQPGEPDDEDLPK
ncbi:MAG: tetratricopeptide repeat protein [Deltaproteobacteria bacterium]|nr:tetratricopeptide repeat protein [Deltaproteobacteria bacterium]